MVAIQQAKVCAMAIRSQDTTLNMLSMLPDNKWPRVVSRIASKSRKSSRHDLVHALQQAGPEFIVAEQHHTQRFLDTLQKSEVGSGQLLLARDYL